MEKIKEIAKDLLGSLEAVKHFGGIDDVFKEILERKLKKIIELTEK